MALRNRSRNEQRRQEQASITTDTRELSHQVLQSLMPWAIDLDTAPLWRLVDMVFDWLYGPFRLHAKPSMHEMVGYLSECVCLASRLQKHASLRLTDAYQRSQLHSMAHGSGAQFEALRDRLSVTLSDDNRA